MRAATGWTKRRTGAGPRLRLATACLTVGLATFAVAVLPASVAEAGTDTVTNCSGSVSVPGSLPYEVANAGSGDTIVFALSPPCPTITLASQIVISEDLTITGPGASAVTVSGGGSVPIFGIPSGVTVAISGLTMDDAYDDTGFGGGIYNDGNLTVTDSTVSGADDTPGYGGAIMNDASGVLMVTGSTLSGNTAGGYGGGIMNDGTLTVSNSTLADNTATGVGGGIDNQGTATVTDTTMTGNEAEFGGNINTIGSLKMGTTILADPVTGTDCHGPGTFTDLGYNLADDGSCGFTSGTDLSSTAAGLDPAGLAHNGGPTQTIALESGSAAIDHVSNAPQCPAIDQRGAPRTAPCDIGAYDTDWGPAVTLDVSGAQSSGDGLSFTYTTNAPGGTVSGTLTCTTVDGGTPISPSLALGSYTIDGSSCSGLTSSDQAAYAVFPSSYVGVPDGFVVSASPPWSISPSPSPYANGQVLNDVSCTSVTFCVAVGNYSNGSILQTLVESWNGSAWSVVSSPDLGTKDDDLNGVSCTSATSCVAVGYYVDASNAEQTLVESWNGASWSTVSSPDDGSALNQLAGVSCTTAAACMAVGSSTAGGTLVESWNGASWAIVSSPDPGVAGNTLNAVSCTSATACMAVGRYSNGTSLLTLTESWNGASWSVVSSPSPGSNQNQLYGVSCTGSTACMAVGESENGSAADETLTESWNGASWSVVSSPDHGSDGNELYGVSCTSSTSCVAVGVYVVGIDYQTLVESWNGSSWALVSSPDQGASDNYLYGVSCTSSTSCVAAGYDLSASVGQTLIEMPPPPVVSAVNPDTGFTTGGNTVTVTGSGFTGATTVDVGANPAAITARSGDTSLTVTVPPGSAGAPVDVIVTAPGGVSTVNNADQYTYTVDQAQHTVPCQPSCTNPVSTTLNQTSVSVVGNSGTSNPGPSTTLVVNTGKLSCGTSKKHDYDYSTAVSDLSTYEFPDTAVLTVTETVGGEPSTAGVKVCYAPGSDPTGAFLKHCPPSDKAPCLVSLTESSDSVIAVIRSPADDPRFWTGVAATDLKSFSPSKGAPGSTVTIKGKNLTAVQAVVIGGLDATISSKSTASKLIVTVPENAVAGPGVITVTAASGQAVSSKKFTVT